MAVDNPLPLSPRVLSVVIGLDLDANLPLIRSASERLGVKGEGIVFAGRR